MIPTATPSTCVTALAWLMVTTPALAQQGSLADELRDLQPRYGELLRPTERPQERARRPERPAPDLVLPWEQGPSRSPRWSPASSAEGEWLSSSGRLFTVLVDVDGSLDVIQSDGAGRAVFEGGWVPGREGSGFEYAAVRATHDPDTDLVHAGEHVWRRLGGRTAPSHWRSTSGLRFTIVEGPLITFDLLQQGGTTAPLVRRARWVDDTRTAFTFEASGYTYTGMRTADGRIRVASGSTVTVWTRQPVRSEDAEPRGAPSVR